MTNDKEIIIVEKIKNSYMAKEQTKLDELKQLDKKVKTPAIVFAYIYGIIGSLVLGTGMCLAMKVIGSSVTALMPAGIVVGIVGIVICLTTYPIYSKILNKRKQKYSKEIISKSDELLNNKGE